MNPYYDEDGIVIYHGDCREIMAGLDFAAMVTDPPYGISYESGHVGTLPRSIVGDEDVTLRDYAISAAGSRPVAAFASWKCRPYGSPRGCLVWRKNIGGMGDLDFPWRPDFELVYVYGAGWTGHRGSSVLVGSTIQSRNTGKARRWHPHEKPVDVMAQIIAKAPEGTILDPFCGSGPTLMAAKLEGRRAIGIEIEERYCEIAANRLRQGALWGVDRQSAIGSDSTP